MFGELKILFFVLGVYMGGSEWMCKTSPKRTKNIKNKQKRKEIETQPTTTNKKKDPPKIYTNCKKIKKKRSKPHKQNKSPPPPPIPPHPKKKIQK